MASSSKAGRSLGAAVPVALGLLALVAASVLWRIEVFVGLVVVALAIGMWEATGAFLNKGRRIPIIPLIAGVIAMVVSTWFSGLPAALVAYAVVVIVSAAWAWSTTDEWVDGAVSASFVLAWIGLLGCFAVALAGLPEARWLIAMLILMPAASDTGGWLFGIMWGKHPMSPSISPKKSWEGFAGSLVLAHLIAFLLVGLGLHQPWYLWMLVAVSAVLCATIGDLSESLLKRDLGVKDMGSIFPGHGGMLDRIDSILMWAPVCFVIMTSPLAAA